MRQRAQLHVQVSTEVAFWFLEVTLSMTVGPQQQGSHRVGLVNLRARLDNGQASTLCDLAEHCLRHLQRQGSA